MITIETPSRNQRYIIHSEALLGFIIEIEGKNMLYAIIEAKGVVELWEIHDPDSMSKYEGILKDIKKHLNDDYTFSKDNGLKKTILSKER